MTNSAMPEPTDDRIAQRHLVDYVLSGKLEQGRTVHLRMANLSAEGFSALQDDDLVQGDRLSLDVPVIGSIHAVVVWTDKERAGFRFDRVIEFDDLSRLIAVIRTDEDLTGVD